MQKPKPANGHTSIPPGADVLNAISSFYRRYLVCDDQQLTILALWTACARSNQRFLAAPYLDVRSPEPQSGKSQCLSLLNFLLEPAFFFTGAPAGTLIQRLLKNRSMDCIDPEDCPALTVLLDNCHHSFGSSEREPLVALLNSGAEMTGFFPYGNEDHYLYGCKAFAGSAPLPRSLAARSIPIVLRPPKPSEQFARLYEDDFVLDNAVALRNGLKQWLEQASSALARARAKTSANLPVTLSPGQRKLSEPLIQIADVAGGLWPAKIRAALPAVFDLADASPQLQMLADLRSIFHLKNDPDYLSTSDLLTELRAMDNRPWSDWSNKSGRRLGGLLRPFGISSSHLHGGGNTDFKGYRKEHFQDAWQRYLPSLTVIGGNNESTQSPDGDAHADGTKTASVPASDLKISAIGAD